MRFSQRTSLHDVPNALTLAAERARAEARAGGRALFDLTSSNPTTASLPYDDGAILRALSDERALRYTPDPLGIAEARSAVSDAYADEGIAISPDRIAITASTSEAYAVLFKLLADPGDEILVPQPSYPLLGFLASFEGVVLKPYPLVYAGAWHVDLEGLRGAVGPRTRAVVVVAPNNPTGQYLADHELDAMLDLGLPVVSDEVFAGYPLSSRRPEGRLGTVLGARRSLVFALSGLSKHVALPQLKLGWIGVAGAEDHVAAAMERLELVLDAYLSVGAPVQHAARSLLAHGARVRTAISERTRRNLEHLRGALRQGGSPATLLDVEAGWYATLRVPETRSDEAWALLLVEEEGVLVHPGYFFDMARGAHLILSLLTPEDDFRAGLTRILRRLTNG